MKTLAPTKNSNQGTSLFFSFESLALTNRGHNCQNLDSAPFLRVPAFLGTDTMKALRVPLRMLFLVIVLVVFSGFVNAQGNIPPNSPHLICSHKFFD
jgi:hypothetical protein